MDSQTKSFNSYTSSVTFLVLSNLFCLLGVLLFKWNPAQIIFMYWSELVVVGIFSIVKIVIQDKWASIINVPIFVLSYGGFLFGCLYLFYFLFNPRQAQTLDENLTIFFIAQIKPVISGLIALLINRVINFKTEVKNLNKDKKQDFVKESFGNVYLIIIVLFVGSLIARSKAVLLTTVLLIVIKTLVEVIILHKQHRKEILGNAFNNFYKDSKII